MRRSASSNGPGIGARASATSHRSGFGMRLSVAAILTALTVLWRKISALRTFLILGAEPIARAGDARDRREREPVFGRITRFRITRGYLEPYLGLVRERVLPEIRALDGFTGYFALIDDARGEVVVLTLW